MIISLSRLISSLILFDNWIDYIILFLHEKTVLLKLKNLDRYRFKKRSNSDC